MIRLKKMMIILVALMLTALSACAPAEPTEPPSPTVDLNAVMTSAAATAFVQLTQIAAAATPTVAPFEPTAAPTEAVPTQDTAAAPTATNGVPVETPAGVLPTNTLPVSADTPIPGITPIPTNTPVPQIVNPGDPLCQNSAFVEDVTIPDGTTFKPWEKFYKVWRIKNTGTCAWDAGFGLIHWAGPSLAGEPIYFRGDEQVAPGGTVDLGVSMYAPGDPGEYISHWVMVNDSGQTFGGDFTVVIKVVK